PMKALDVQRAVGNQRASAGAPDLETGTLLSSQSRIYRRQPYLLKQRGRVVGLHAPESLFWNTARPQPADVPIRILDEPARTAPHQIVGADDPRVPPLPQAVSTP